MKRSIVDYIAENAARAPERTAIFHRERRISYRELEELAAKCRGALAARGVKAGDRVSLVMSDSPEMGCPTSSGTARRSSSSRRPSISPMRRPAARRI